MSLLHPFYRNSLNFAKVLCKTHCLKFQMKIGIMQPYFLPYLGYFQLMSACDSFVVYDNIKFTKKGWINRNRMLLNGKDTMFSIPLKNDSDFLDIDQRFIGENFDKEKAKILGQIRAGYKNAVCFKEVFPVIEAIFNFPDRNLFRFLFHSIVVIKDYLNVHTPLVISSTVDADHSLKGKYRVLEICKKLGGDVYINPIGGTELYNKEEFGENNIELYFHKMKPVNYDQNGHAFIHYLSILDVMMFNDKLAIAKLLPEFDLVQNGHPKT